MRLARRLATLAAALAVSCLVPPASRAQEADPEQPLEVTFRHVAKTFCRWPSCYLAVEGKPPSEALLKRLHDVPNIRPMTPTGAKGPTPRELDLVIDLHRPEFLPERVASREGENHVRSHLDACG